VSLFERYHSQKNQRYITEDTKELKAEIALPFTNNAKEAQRICKIALVLNAPFIDCSGVQLISPARLSSLIVLTGASYAPTKRLYCPPVDDIIA
jgi:hypothetical protein